MRGEKVIATWSGGIDSTAVIAKMLREGWSVKAVSLDLDIYGDTFAEREAKAREILLPRLENLGEIEHEQVRGLWLDQFADGQEVPLRNRRILDWLIANYPEKNLAMGEYVGCDTWVVRDHVGAADCDARALTSYLYTQYGLDYRLVTLADFGESRYKMHRLGMGVQVLGDRVMSQTTNCLANEEIHCGECYKCVERAAAFEAGVWTDWTEYLKPPKESPHYQTYFKQQFGEEATIKWQEFSDAETTIQ